MLAHQVSQFIGKLNAASQAIQVAPATAGQLYSCGIHKQSGGTISPALTALTRDLWLWRGTSHLQPNTFQGCPTLDGEGQVRLDVGSSGVLESQQDTGASGD